MKFLKYLNDLVCRDGKLSHTKLWSNIAYGVFTWAIIYKTVNNTASDDLWMIYIATVALHTTASNLLNKYNFKGDSNDKSSS